MFTGLNILKAVPNNSGIIVTIKTTNSTNFNTASTIILSGIKIGKKTASNTFITISIFVSTYYLLLLLIQKLIEIN
jgi:hypothetical protein